MDFTIAAWVYLANLDTDRPIVAKFHVTAGTNDYVIRYQKSSNRFRWGVADGTNTIGLVNATTFGAPSINTWYLVVAHHDAANNQVGIAINNGAIDVAATTGAAGVTNVAFELGAWLQATAFYHYGRLGPVAMWKSAAGGGGVLTEAQRTALWNGGNGLAYADFDYAGSEPWYLAGGINPTSCIAAYQPIGAASLAASYTNLANPGTYNAAPGTAPTWASATGWTFNGSDQYLTTGIVPNVSYSMCVRFANLGGGVTYAVAGGSGVAAFDIFPIFGSTSHAYTVNTPRVVVAGKVTDGVLAIAPGAGYINGVNDASLGALTGSTGQQIYLGGRNLSGVQSNLLAGNIQAIAIYDAPLTAAQVASVSAAMTNLTG